ncbi:hypothetical protein [Planctomicrobium sp. SH664]|uniref:hypothetical protein n=1 Tax=Planctomicrobium sp. SH664 TaxID=3448125 RepID=UPI003F5B26C2
MKWRQLARFLLYATLHQMRRWKFWAEAAGWVAGLCSIGGQIAAGVSSPGNRSAAFLFGFGLALSATRVATRISRGASQDSEGIHELLLLTQLNSAGVFWLTAIPPVLLQAAIFLLFLPLLTLGTAVAGLRWETIPPAMTYLVAFSLTVGGVESYATLAAGRFQIARIFAWAI